MLIEVYWAEHGRKRAEEHRNLIRDVDLDIEIKEEEVVMEEEIKDATMNQEQHPRKASQDSVLALFDDDELDPKESKLLNHLDDKGNSSEGEEEG